jgi:hypothetical protein
MKDAKGKEEERRRNISVLSAKNEDCTARNDQILKTLIPDSSGTD